MTELLDLSFKVLEAGPAHSRLFDIFQYNMNQNIFLQSTQFNSEHMPKGTSILKFYSLNCIILASISVNKYSICLEYSILNQKGQTYRAKSKFQINNLIHEFFAKNSLNISPIVNPLTGQLNFRFFMLASEISQTLLYQIICKTVNEHVLAIYGLSSKLLQFLDGTQQKCSPMNKIELIKDLRILSKKCNQIPEDADPKSFANTKLSPTKREPPQSIQGFPSFYHSPILSQFVFYQKNLELLVKEIFQTKRKIQNLLVKASKNSHKRPLLIDEKSENNILMGATNESEDIQVSYQNFHISTIKIKKTDQTQIRRTNYILSKLRAGILYKFLPVYFPIKTNGLALVTQSRKHSITMRSYLLANSNCLSFGMLMRFFMLILNCFKILWEKNNIIANVSILDEIEVVRHNTVYFNCIGNFQYVQNVDKHIHYGQITWKRHLLLTKIIHFYFYITFNRCLVYQRPSTSTDNPYRMKHYDPQLYSNLIFQDQSTFYQFWNVHAKELSYIFIKLLQKDEQDDIVMPNIELINGLLIKAMNTSIFFKEER